MGVLKGPHIELRLYHVTAGEPEKILEQGKLGPFLPLLSLFRKSGERCPNRLPLEAPSLPLATDSWRTTETQRQSVERAHQASELMRARGTPVRLSRGLSREGGTSGGDVFSFRLLAIAGPSLTGPCAPRPPGAPSRRAAATMKKFFQEIKADIKFKSAGPGQKLTESVGLVTGAGP